MAEFCFTFSLFLFIMMMGNIGRIDKLEERLAGLENAICPDDEDEV